MSSLNIRTFILFVLFTACACDGRRPFYIIGHMVNSIEQVRRYLDNGANVIETDIQFHPNGSVKEAYHGFPCDCFRTCTRSANLKDFLTYVRNITNPNVPGSYANKMVMQFFDLKLSSSAYKRISGREIAKHILDYLWTKDESRTQEVRALIYIDDSSDAEAFEGFIEEFKSRDALSRLKDVGFDGGSGDLGDIRRMFARLGITNIWQGDGKSNCLSPLYPDGRLRTAVGIRESRNGFPKKVYHWTIDLKLRMRLSLNIGVDGMITNDPDDLLEVIHESYYRNEYRLATPDDDPFVKYDGP